MSPRRFVDSAPISAKAQSRKDVKHRNKSVAILRERKRTRWRILSFTSLTYQAAVQRGLQYHREKWKRVAKRRLWPLKSRKQFSTPSPWVSAEKNQDSPGFNLNSITAQGHNTIEKHQLKSTMEDFQQIKLLNPSSPFDSDHFLHASSHEKTPSKSRPTLKAGSSKVRLWSPDIPTSGPTSARPQTLSLSTTRSETGQGLKLLSSSNHRTAMPPPDSPSALRQPQPGRVRSLHNDQRHHQMYRQNRNRSLDDGANWREYSHVDIDVTGLPPIVTTLQIWKNFHEFGNISSIFIKDNNMGYSSASATICYKPPPTEAFFEKSAIRHFQRGDKSICPIRVELAKKQRRNFTISSPNPARAGCRYNEEHILLGDSIDFGVLTDASSMLICKTRKSDGQFGVKFHLDLKRQQITIYFPSAIRSEKSGLVVREHRFKIPFDQDFVLSEVAGSENQAILLLEVKKPPPYSKKLAQAAKGSHVKDSRRWSEEDLWARQTDILDSKNLYTTVTHTIPVSTQNKFASIDIGRWLAFRLVIPTSEEVRVAFDIVRSALRDFNIPIRNKAELRLKVVAPGEQPILWPVLNRMDFAEDRSAVLSLRDLGEPTATLPFSLRYQLEVCVSHGYLSEYEVDEDFLNRLASLPITKAVHLLKAVDIQGRRIFNPMSIFENITFCKPIRAPKLPENCIEIHHATVTASKIYFHTPSVEITNRVLRQYKQHAERFLRVRFEDDEWRGQTRLYSATNNKMSNIFLRVKRTLTNGIILGNKHYKFLACGNSQFREHGAYFFADVPGVITAGNIRAKMGEFSTEKIVAKRAARMGQCFSTTRSLACRIPRVQHSECIEDVKTADGRYLFTDGVGMMSTMVATLAGLQMGLKGDPPSVVQFRLGGCKGVLAIEPSMTGINVRVRESQWKFASSANELEIIRCSSYSTADLNRQLIIVLSELGVPDRIFLEKQQNLINDINSAMIHDDIAVKALKDRVDPNFMTPILADIIDVGGFTATKEPFVTATKHLWRSWTLKYLKEKARLPIPKSAFVFGISDETKTLRGHSDGIEYSESDSMEKRLKDLPQIFLQITDPHTGEIRVIEEVCVLARNPSLHRGDVRIVQAVDVPALHHLRDAVVFPQKGDRDLASMCSGGDVDGDDYLVIWDETLLPAVWNVPPFHYEPPTPKQAVGEVTTEHIVDFFVDYMENDFLGRIAHAHLAWADDKGVDCEQCLELVQLHSLSVDFPKTGVPARMERRLERVDGMPHFMEKKGKTYKSWKILGRLYNAVEKVNFKPNYQSDFDRRILHALRPSEMLRSQAKLLKAAYDESMQQIMAQHAISTEFEVWTTFVLDHSKKSSDYKFHEEIGRLSSCLKEQYMEEIVTLMGGRQVEQLAPFAVAAYQITQEEVAEAKASEHENTGGDGEGKKMPLISFPWVLHDTLSKVAAAAGVASSPFKTAEANVAIRFDEEGKALPTTPFGAGLDSQDHGFGHRYVDPWEDAKLPETSAQNDEGKDVADEGFTMGVQTNGITDLVDGDIEDRFRAVQLEDDDSD